MTETHPRFNWILALACLAVGVGLLWPVLFFVVDEPDPLVWIWSGICYLGVAIGLTREVGEGFPNGDDS